MDAERDDGRTDALTLRFVGEDEDGTALHELRAVHVAEVLLGVAGLTGDFAKAGAFGEGIVGSEVLVRPAQEGSFVIEVLRWIQENQEALAAGATATGVPTLSQIVWWATRSARADVKDFEYLENGNVKVVWQDDTVDEIPLAAWRELNKRDRRRKKQLRQIMAPLSDQRVTAVEVQGPPVGELDEAGSDAEPFTLRRPDYDAVRPDDEVSETQETFETEAQMSAIDFEDPTRWRVRTASANRLATLEDEEFLGRVAGGLAIRKSDIFRLKVRQDAVQKNGRTRRTWTVLQVISHRRAASDGDA